MNEEIIYFELNNWMPNKDYPNAEPFETWTSYEHFNFDNEDWIKENKLVVVRTIVDMSANWCITATKEWVLKIVLNCLLNIQNFLDTQMKMKNCRMEDLAVHFMNIRMKI